MSDPTFSQPPADETSRNDDRTIFRIACGLLALIAISGVACDKRPTGEEHARSKNNLKQLALAMHNYHDTHGVFPPGAIVTEAGVARHGWATSILPFVDQSPIYSQIDLNQPWNAPVNEVIKNRIPGYLQPAVEQTTDAAGYGLNHYAGNVHVFQPNRSFRFRETKDGVSNTFFLGEIDGGFQPWGKPGNVRDIATGLSGGSTNFGSVNPDRVIIVMMDGAAKTISKDIDPAILKAISTPDGGEAQFLP